MVSASARIPGVLAQRGREAGKLTGVRTAALAAGIAAAVSLASPLEAAEELPFVKDGRAAFVLSDIRYALAEGDAEVTGVCPNGFSLQLQEIFAMGPEGKRRPGESDEEFGRRLQQGARTLGAAPDGRDFCQHPELAEPDPHFRTVEVSDVRVEGIPLGSTSAVVANARTDQRFPSLEGEGQVENQFYRLVGCSRSFQSGGQSNGFVIEMLTGSWGILVTLDDVDDIHNDDHVEVGLYANGDPIRLSPSREPLPYATYAIKDDERFKATTRGRIENGVLISEPVDVRFQHVVNSMLLERVIRAAIVHLNINADGTLEGYLAGYSPVEELYDYQFGFRNGKTFQGELAPLRLRSGSSNGAAFVLGHTCHGIYHAMYELADGHPDPDTGKYTSLSTQYKIKAIPAFVFDPATVSSSTAQSVEVE